MCWHKLQPPFECQQFVYAGINMNDCRRANASLHASPTGRHETTRGSSVDTQPRASVICHVKRSAPPFEWSHLCRSLVSLPSAVSTAVADATAVNPSSLLYRSDEVNSRTAANERPVGCSHESGYKSRREHDSELSCEQMRGGCCHSDC